MAPKILQSELVLSARDKTGAVFDQVGAKFDKLAAAGKKITGVGRDFLNVGSMLDRTATKFDHAARGISNAGNALDRAAANVSKAGKEFERVSRVGGLVGAMAAAGAAYKTEHVTASLAEHMARAGIEGQHERVRMEAAGMSPEEISEAEVAASDLATKIPAISQTTALHMLRNVRSIVGTFAEAKELLEPVARARVVALGAHPERKEELEQEFDLLVKSEEIKGATMDLPRFTRNMDLMAKAINAFGDTLRPVDFYAMVKYARGASQSLSDQFFLQTAPTFAQEMGGSSAGKAFGTAYATVVGGRMRAVAATELLKLGLIDRDKIEISKAGLVKRVTPGAVTGWEMFAVDPYRWVNEIFLPALRAHGITDKQRMLSEISTVFRDQTAAQFVAILATQQSRIMKDWGISQGAKGLEAADVFMNKDVTVAWQSLTEQLKNFLQVAGGPLAQPAAGALRAIANSLAYLSDAARKHPAAQKAETAGLLGLIGAGALGSYEIAIAAMRKFGWLGEEWGSRLARLPITAIRTPLSWLASAAMLNPYVDAALAAASVLAPTPAGESDAAELKRRTDAQAEQLKSGMPAWLGMGVGPGAEKAWDEWAFAQRQPAKAELSGDATVTVKVELDEGLRAAIEHAGEIPGITLKGSTGSRGVAWPDVSAGNIVP